MRNRALDGVKFRRQQPIGPYIVDLVSFERRLVIEIDGGHHNETATKQYDLERSRWLGDDGYRVLRFWNNDVLTNIEGVLAKIREVLGEAGSPSP